MRDERDWEEIFLQAALIWIWPTAVLIILVSRYLGF